MRAALRPGRAATTLASTSTPSATRATDRTRHAGLGNRIDLSGEESPEPAPQDYSKRHAEHDPDDGSDRRLPGQSRCQLSVRETQRFQQGKVMSPPPHRCRQGEAESDDRTRGEGGCEQGGGGTHGSEVHDFGRALHTYHRHRVALTAAIGHGCEVAVGNGGDPLQARETLAVSNAFPEAHEDKIRAVEGRVGVAAL